MKSNNSSSKFSKDAHPPRSARPPQYTADEQGLKRAITRLQQFERDHNRLPKSSDKELGSIASAVKRGRWTPLGVPTWNELMRRAFGRINVERTIYASTKEGLKKAIQALKDYYTTHNEYPKSTDPGMGVIVTAIHANRWTHFGIHTWADLFTRAFGFAPKKLRQNPYEGQKNSAG